MANLLKNLLFCRTANGFDLKGIVMAFYKVVLRPTEGPVFNSTKDTMLLIDQKKKLVISIVLSKVCDRIIMLSWLKKLLSFGQSAPAIIWEHVIKKCWITCSNKKRCSCALLEDGGWKKNSRKKINCNKIFFNPHVFLGRLTILIFWSIRIFVLSIFILLHIQWQLENNLFWRVKKRVQHLPNQSFLYKDQTVEFGWKFHLFFNCYF